MALSWICAAGEVPPFMPVLATIVVAAAVAGWICQRIGLVPVVGFLVAGVLVGPYALGVVESADAVEVAAEVGVILLLFAIGIEFSLDRLARIKKLVIGGGSLTVVLTATVTTVVVLATGGAAKPAIYTGLLVSVSSTAVVLSLLANRHETGSPSGQLSIAVLVFEDLAVVGMVLLVPMLGTEGGSVGELVRAVLVTAALLVGVLVVARRVMPRILEVVARACSPEVFLLAVLAICFATAYVTSLAGVSVSLGAFLAGLVVSESRFSAHALGEVLPLQIVFTATFFVSVGMLLDPRFLVDQPLLVAAVLVGVVLIKAVTGTVAARLVGVALPIAIASSFLRAQIGEFSFVLQQVGAHAGLSPGDLGDDGVQAFLAGSVLLMILTPALAPLGRQLGRRFERPDEPHPLSEPTALDDERSDHVIVAGYGDAARALVPGLRQADVPFVVLTLNPDGAAHAEAMGLPVLLGDSSKRFTLEEAGVRRARSVVIADDDVEMAQRITTLAASLNPDGSVSVRVDEHGANDLARAGAGLIVTGDRAAAEVLRDAVVDDYFRGVTATEAVDTRRVVRFAPTMGWCTHAARIRAVRPSATGCEECLQMGDEWVHLRMCTECGHVGCCDDSPNRHARAHASDEHPVMRSIEPGDRWGWCFVDELDLVEHQD